MLRFTLINYLGTKHMKALRKKGEAYNKRRPRRQHNVCLGLPQSDIPHVLPREKNHATRDRVDRVTRQQI